MKYTYIGKNIPVRMSPDVRDSIAFLASKASGKTCFFLKGVEENGGYTITDVMVPKQKTNTNTCEVRQKDLKLLGTEYIGICVRSTTATMSSADFGFVANSMYGINRYPYIQVDKAGNMTAAVVDGNIRIEEIPIDILYDTYIDEASLAKELKSVQYDSYSYNTKIKENVRPMESPLIKGGWDWQDVV